MPNASDPLTYGDRTIMFAPGGPERLLRVGPSYLAVDQDTDVPPGAVGGRGEAQMGTGAWVLGAGGRPSNGATGIITDDVLGIPVLAARPPGHWAVTMEMTLDFCAPVPADGSLLTAQSVAVQVTADGGLGRGSVTDPAGRVIATGTQRLRYIPGAPLDLFGSSRDEPPEQPVAPLLDVLGVDVDGSDPRTLHLPPDPRLGNPLGNLHGGILLTLSEVVALRSVQSADYPLDSSSIRIVYVRPGPVAEQITFVAEPIHRGRTLAVVRVLANRPDGKPCSVATVTCHGPR